MKTEKIHAVEMTREIRDRMYEETKDLAPDQLLEYIRDRSRTARRQVEDRELSVRR